MRLSWEFCAEKVLCHGESKTKSMPMPNCQPLMAAWDRGDREEPLLWEAWEGRMVALGVGKAEGPIGRGERGG